MVNIQRLICYFICRPNEIYSLLKYAICYILDTPATDAAKSEDKTTNGVTEKEEVKEVEEVTYTLDEWKAQQGEKQGQAFNTRKAGEGADLDPKWKKTYAYKKEKETHDEEDEEVRLNSIT